MTSPTPPELVKWYTRARRFPQLIGRTPDGAKIWGGPYTFTQAIGAGVIALVAINTMGLWANYGFIGNTLLLVAVTYGGVLFLGRIPVGARSPISLIAGGMHAAFAPRMGRLGGRTVRPRRPHLVRHRVIVTLDQAKPRRAALPRQRTTLPVRQRPETSKSRTAKTRTSQTRTAQTRTAQTRTAQTRTAKHVEPKPSTAKPQTAKSGVVQPTPAAKPTAVQPIQPATAPTPAPRPNLTGVQTLLAQGRTPSERH